MALRIIQNRVAANQSKFDSTDGEKNMLGKAFNRYLDSLIRENCTYKDGCYQLQASDIPYEDRKLLLSYLVHIEDYEDFTRDKTREIEAIKDYEPEMQYLIDKRIDDVWHEDMQEMGRTLCHCRQTGEPYYS